MERGEMRRALATQANGKDEASMIRNICSALVLSSSITMLLACAQSAPAQSTQAAQPTEEQMQVSTIPVDQQASLEQIAKLFAVIRVKQQVDSIAKMMPAITQQQIQEQTKQIAANFAAGRQLTPKEQAALEELQKKIMDKALNMYPHDVMIEDLAKVYQRHVTKSDVDALIAFYSSPVGQRLLDEQPAIMKEYMPQVMKRVDENSKELTDEILKDIASLVKESGEPAKTSAPK
jgi:hypothetical protein